MSTIDQNSQNSLSAILDKLGVSRADEKKQAARNTLGQEDFLKLMTTQLQNQDPFAPMENGDFIAQMAQFSTVTGITDMGETLKGLSSQLSEFRLATATNLLGSSVLIPGNTARPNENGEIHGVVDLPSASTATSITISDMNGEVID
ncbi:MAG: flagellar hook capping FlgD N-terminal domain-containing protein, partial [Pseudomonadota bacterium]|nr:flagellar hook capping FlgD N-terminal domain-containing protein [Pseudomonadota bacterium]